MRRISTATATINNQFTNGNPSTGVKATQFEAPWCNAVQEEIAQCIESAGLVVDQNGDQGAGSTQDNNQLYKAILLMLQNGGAQVNQAINNLVSPGSAIVISGMTFDKSEIHSVFFDYSIERTTDSNSARETGRVSLTVNSVTDAWEIEQISFFSGAGVVFYVDSSGEVSYSSDDLPGTTYSGQIRITNIVTIKQ